MNANKSNTDIMSSSNEYDASSRTTSLDEMMFKIPFEAARRDKMVDEEERTQCSQSVNSSTNVSPVMETLQPIQFPKPFSL